MARDKIKTRTSAYVGKQTTPLRDDSARGVGRRKKRRGTPTTPTTPHAHTSPPPQSTAREGDHSYSPSFAHS